MIDRIIRFNPNLNQSLILFLLTAFVGSMLAGFLSIILNWIFRIDIAISTFILYPFIFIPATLYIAYKSYSEEISNDDNKSYINKRAKMGLYLISAPLLIAINIVAENTYSWMDVPDFIFKLQENMGKYPISGFITVVIFAPILEELLCRGIILRGLLKHISPIKAILVSSLIFSLMHLNPWQSIPAFISGIYIGWLYYISGSLFLAMFVHFFNNLISYSILFLYPNLPINFTTHELLGTDFTITLIVSILVILSLVTFINKKYGKSLSFKI